MHPTLQLKHYSFMFFSSRCNPFSILLLFLFWGYDVIAILESQMTSSLTPCFLSFAPSFTADPTTTPAILQAQEDSTAHKMLRPYHMPQSASSDCDGAPRPQPSNLLHSKLMISVIYSRAIHQLFKVPFSPDMNKTGQHMFQ